MSKKKILIVNNNMHIGGVQKALVNLLKCVHDKYDVTLVLFYPCGDLMQDIPTDVHLQPIGTGYRFLGMTKADVLGKPFLKLARGVYATICRLIGRKTAISIMALGQKQLTGYDAVISYLHDAGDKVFYGGCNEFVLKHTKAPLRCTFLHCDYMTCGANTTDNARRYACFDRVAACSEGCQASFLKALPELTENTVVVRNCQDYATIRRSAAEAPVALASDCLNIVTVARLGREKGVPRAIEAFAKLGDVGGRYHYYIVGDGVERVEVECLIRQHALENKVTLVGELVNPYGYMKAADLLLLPSVSEAAPMVIAESACLGTPILSTRTTSAWEMIEATGYGWVCDNSVDGICEELQKLLKNQEMLQEKAADLAGKSFDNHQAMRQFKWLIESSEEREKIQE